RQAPSPRGLSTLCVDWGSQNNKAVTEGAWITPCVLPQLKRIQKNRGLAPAKPRLLPEQIKAAENPSHAACPWERIGVFPILYGYIAASDSSFLYRYFSTSSTMFCGIFRSTGSTAALAISRPKASTIRVVFSSASAERKLRVSNRLWMY